MRSRSLFVGLTAALALPFTACITATAEDGGSGGCGTNAQGCLVSTDCCTGFACVNDACTFTGSGNNSAGTSNGGNGTGGGSTGTASNGTNGTGSSNGGTGAGCSSSVSPFNEYSSCTGTSACACPMSCVTESGVSYCAASCTSSSTCPGVFDTCSGGLCGPSIGCTAAQLCNSGDGTCVEVAEQTGQDVAVCVRGGTIPVGSSCSLSVLNPQSPPVSSSQLCAPGSFCSPTLGTCQLVCTVGQTGACAAGQTCTTFPDVAPTFGVCEPSGTTNGGSTGGTSTTSGTGGFAIAPHQAFPQMQNNGVPAMTSPQLVTMSYTGYEATYPIQTYADWMVSSQWLTTVGAPFGIGTGSHIDVVLPGSGPSSTSLQDSDIQSFIQSTVTSDTSLPQPSGTTPTAIYMIYYPENVTITLSSGGATTGTSCTSFGGYHSSFTDTSGNVWVYAVIPTCSDFEPGLSVLQSVEFASSHEFIEAATDPWTNTGTGQTGYNLSSDYTDSWAFDLEEVADLCVGAPIQNYNGDMATESWDVVGSPDSDSSPCTPWPSGSVYYNVSPVAQGFTNALAYWAAGSAPTTATWTITGWSNASTSDWTLYAIQTVGTFQISPSSIVLSAPGQASGQTVTINNGGTATLTVTLPSGLTSQSYAAIEILSSQNFASQPITYSEWPVALYVE